MDFRNLQVGSPVDYVPKWRTIEISGSISGTSINQMFQTEKLQWIYGGKIKQRHFIVPKAPTKQVLHLKGSVGYKYSMYILNQISNLYSTEGAKAVSITKEVIEAKLKWEVPFWINSRWENNYGDGLFERGVGGNSSRSTVDYLLLESFGEDLENRLPVMPIVIFTRV